MQHLAIIPDGNRRWAKQHKLESIFGHQRGTEIVKTAINVCLNHEIPYLSLYTFSLENFNRSDLEKNYLFNLLIDSFAKEQLAELIRGGIRIRFIGDHTLFPPKLHNTITYIQDQTKHLSKLNLNLLFCYGAKTEITHAVRKLAQQAKDGLIDVNQINEDSIHNALWTADIPDPDLIIRTGGIVRLSNFLLYQAAYSEFTFLDCYWPEVTQELLEQCIQKFETINRNFGR